MDKPKYLTLTDVAQLTHNGELVTMVQEIERNTSIFNSLPWKQSSDMTRDITGVAGEPPKGTWVGLDKGVKANKSSWTQREEGLATCESWAEINEKTYKISPYPDQVRWQNDKMHIAGLALDAEAGLLYGNPKADPNQILGFMPRLSRITDRHGMYDSGTKQADFVTLNAGGNNAGAMSSILIVAKGPMAAHLLYPRYQTENGLVYRHFNFENTIDAEGGNVRIAKSQFMVTFGLSIANRRTVVRIANIDTTSDASMEKVQSLLYEAFSVIPRIYRSSVDIWAPASVNLALRKKFESRVTPATHAEAAPQNAYGDIYFDKFVIKECDSMLETEDVIQ